MQTRGPIPVRELICRALPHLTPEVKESYWVPLLPILEHRWTSACVDLRQELVARNLLARREDTIAATVVCRALNQSSPYWAELALRWIQDGFPVPEETLPSLLLLAENKSLSQSIRHEAWRLYHKSA